MFTDIDQQLFGSPCEVVMTSQGYVFPIFKNGSSSLRKIKTSAILNQQIKRCEEITVYLREPKQRYVSGMYTFVKEVMRENEGLDEHTVFHMVRSYLCVNRHYMAQFLWICNLATYTDPNCKLRLRPVTDVEDLTPLRLNQTSDLIDPEFSKKVLAEPALEAYIKLDEFLLEKLGQTVLWSDVMVDLRTVNPLLYNLVFGVAQRLSNVLPSP